MKTNKPLLIALVVVLIGGLMALNYFTQPQETDSHDGHDHGKMSAPPTPNPVRPKEPKVVKQVKIYLVDSHGGELTLKPTERGLVEGQEKISALMAAKLLCMGAGANEALQNPIPPRVQVLGLTVENGLATVNFSSELKRNHPGGSEWEALTVSSIVKTLTQFPEINRVQILIDGKKESDLAGHVDISEPLSRNERFL